MDVNSSASFLGLSERALRARVARNQVPYRKLGGRIVFVKSELEAFMASLNGVSLDEALGNLQRELPEPNRSRSSGRRLR